MENVKGRPAKDLRGQATQALVDGIGAMPMQGAGATPPVGKALSEVERGEVVAWLAIGMGVPEIASHFGVSRNVIHGIRRRMCSRAA